MFTIIVLCAGYIFCGLTTGFSLKMLRDGPDSDLCILGGMFWPLTVIIMLAIAFAMKITGR